MLVPTLDQKRGNSLRVKTLLMKQLQGADFAPARHEWDDLVLIIPADVQYEMEQKLISSAEIQEAIWQAETAGDYFFDQEEGGRLATLTKPIFTYWVQYRETAPKTYEVVAAYSHRMRIQP
jgi:hypothetical protein